MLARKIIRTAAPWVTWVAPAIAAVLLGNAGHAKPPKDRSESPAAASKAAAEPAPGEKWVRLVQDEKGRPVAMQTAIVRYADAERPASKAGGAPDRYVDLVGAVHIGDLAYYRELNRRFAGYDAVLYELVAPEGTVVPRGRGTSNSHPLGALQNGMKSMLEVEHQLEQIDYTRPNFVHADLSGDEFLAAMAERKEGFVEMYFKLLGASLAHENQRAKQGVGSELDFFSALISSDRPRQLKIAMANQFEGMEQLMVGFAGPDGSTLITDRNNRALDVLEKQLALGKTRLAIFYGAGHLTEMHDQMDRRFRMRPVSVEWVDAWDLRK